MRFFYVEWLWKTRELRESRGRTNSKEEMSNEEEASASHQEKHNIKFESEVQKPRNQQLPGGWTNQPSPSSSYSSLSLSSTSSSSIRAVVVIRWKPAAATISCWEARLTATGGHWPGLLEISSVEMSRSPVTFKDFLLIQWQNWWRQESCWAQQQQDWRQSWGGFREKVSSVINNDNAKLEKRKKNDKNKTPTLTFEQQEKQQLWRWTCWAVFTWDALPIEGPDTQV